MDLDPSKIPEGGTQALIYALMIAVVALAGAVGWLVKVLLNTQKEKDDLHKDYGTEMKRIQEARVEESKRIIQAAEILKNATEIFVRER